jgi:transcriptional regulator with XRE-family HTH domain
VPEPDASTERDTSAEVSRAIAANLRALRARRGWSLDHLAQRSGVSKGALVALEGDRGNPSLNTLVRLADAFAVSLSDLVEACRRPALRRVHADQATVLWRGPFGGTGRLILSTDPPNPVELWHWRLEPGERKDSEAHAEDTQEALLVTEGELTVEADGHSALAPAGTAVALPGDKPHGYRNDGTSATVYLLIIKVPQ